MSSVERTEGSRLADVLARLRTTEIYVGGAWVPSTSSATIPVVNPATEDVLAEVPAGSADDVDRAVAAAQAAFATWSGVAADERGKYLARLAEALDARRDEVAEIVTAEVGSPIGFSKAAQAGIPVNNLNEYAAYAATFRWEEPLGGSLLVRAPVGVVGAITPWNVPLHQIVLKVAPALLAGCTVVLKPSEVAPLNAYVLAEAAHEIGLPPGVLNVVSGAAEVGEALVRHPGVDMISFTGSSRAGRHIAAVAADTVKRVALEMGGKSACILLDDADLDAAVAFGVQRCMLNGGQVCIGLSRMLVPRSRYDEVVERATAVAASLTVGDPHVATVGPLVSAAQRDRVRGYIATGIEEGARLTTGGADAPEGLDTGYFVRPTVFADVDNSMTIAREEIFGPVLSIIPYDGDDEAVAIANDTPYGLSGAVWSADVERATRVARRLRTGEVLVNGAYRPPGSPFGGFKQSGLGREGGTFGLEEFVELQTIALPPAT